MNVRELMQELALLDGDLPVTILATDGASDNEGQMELIFHATNVVTIEGGGAAPAFVALNVSIP